VATKDVGSAINGVTHYNVVPAKAGTHTPSRMLWARRVVPPARNNDHRWLWIPAFAGTTPNIQCRS
jgi:hypothetical protein